MVISKQEGFMQEGVSGLGSGVAHPFTGCITGNQEADRRCSSAGSRDDDNAWHGPKHHSCSHGQGHSWNSKNLQACVDTTIRHIPATGQIDRSLLAALMRTHDWELSWSQERFMDPGVRGQAMASVPFDTFSMHQPFISDEGESESSAA